MAHEIARGEVEIEPVSDFSTDSEEIGVEIKAQVLQSCYKKPIYNILHTRAALVKTLAYEWIDYLGRHFIQVIRSFIAATLVCDLEP